MEGVRLHFNLDWQWGFFLRDSGFVQQGTSTQAGKSMLDTIWRISATEFDVKYFIHQFKIKDTSAIFLKGEIGWRGIVNKESGVNVLVSEELNSNENIEEISEFIKNNSEALKYLLSNNISSTMDIGCSVGTTDQYIKSVTAPPDLLLLLNKYAISLQFSAYPATDDENET